MPSGQVERAAGTALPSAGTAAVVLCGGVSLREVGVAFLEAGDVEKSEERGVQLQEEEGKAKTACRDVRVGIDSASVLRGRIFWQAFMMLAVCGEVS